MTMETKQEKAERDVVRHLERALASLNRATDAQDAAGRNDGMEWRPAYLAVRALIERARQDYGIPA